MKNKKFTEFCEYMGGTASAAEKLGCSVGYIYLLRNGTRRISRKVAEKCELASNGKFKKEKMLWSK